MIKLDKKLNKLNDLSIIQAYWFNSFWTNQFKNKLWKRDWERVYFTQRDEGIIKGYSYSQ